MTKLNTCNKIQWYFDLHLCLLGRYLRKRHSTLDSSFQLWVASIIHVSNLLLNTKIMVPYNYTEFIDKINSQIQKKLIPANRINDAVKRILRVKFTMGLFEEPLADLSFANQLGSKAHMELAREAVRKSLVLLKVSYFCRAKTEEARIMSWENLQNAKAEAAIRKLEVEAQN